MEALEEMSVLSRPAKLRCIVHEWSAIDPRHNGCCGNAAISSCNRRTFVLVDAVVPQHVNFPAHKAHNAHKAHTQEENNLQGTIPPEIAAITYTLNINYNSASVVIYNIQFTLK